MVSDPHVAGGVPIGGRRSGARVSSSLCVWALKSSDQNPSALGAAALPASALRASALRASAVRASPLWSSALRAAAATSASGVAFGGVPVDRVSLINPRRERDQALVIRGDGRLDVGFAGGLDVDLVAVGLTVIAVAALVGHQPSPWRGGP